MKKLYCKVYHDAMRRMQINTTEYIIASLIQQFTTKKEYCTISKKWISVFLNKSVRYYLKCRRNLEERGLIDLKEKNKNEDFTEMKVTDKWNEHIKGATYDKEYFTIYWYKLANDYSLTYTDYFVLYAAYYHRNKKDNIFEVNTEIAKKLNIYPSNLTRTLKKLTKNNSFIHRQYDCINRVKKGYFVVDESLVIELDRRKNTIKRRER